MTASNERYREIDLFRAVAVSMVIAFHYLSRWTPPKFDINAYPYANYFADVTIFKFGYLGVDFFFIISGFVIALTLANSGSIGEFFARRLARLLPAMIFCSLVTLIFVKVFVSFPYFTEEASLWNLLPSWTFTDPRLWAKISPVSSHVDGAYWSLVVEVKFYVWAALIYFFNRDRFLRNMSGFCVLSSLAFLAGQAFSIKPIQAIDSYLLFGSYAMLFLAGITFYELSKKRENIHRLWPILAVCFVLEAAMAFVSTNSAANMAIPLLFKAAFYLAFLACTSGWKLGHNTAVDFGVKVGIASYPLYLLHQNIGVGVLHRSIGLENPVLVVLLFFGLCATMVYASLCVHNFVERPGKRLLMSLLRDRRYQAAISP